MESLVVLEQNLAVTRSFSPMTHAEMQELMRQADPGTIMRLYTQAVSADKRRAQTRIIKSVVGPAKNKGRAAMAS